MMESPRDRGSGTYDDVESYVRSSSNWGRWGEEDELGTLNLITPERRRAAAALVREGVAVSCSRDVMFAPKADPQEAMVPPVHFMQRSGESAAAGLSAAFDWVGLPLHGLHLTHLDAHSHIFWDGQMYNGRPASSVVTDRGALQGGVDLAKDGIFSRGVLLDIPLATGREVGSTDGVVELEDLRKAEDLAGVTVEAGDVALVRTGYGAIRRQPSGASAIQPGMDIRCLDWIAERSPSVLATDSGTDCVGREHAPDQVIEPIHVVCLVAMGMWIVDCCDLESLAATCTRLNRWEFLLYASPIRLKNSTGSPINPIAVF